jgi:hypothetical protein
MSRQTALTGKKRSMQAYCQDKTADENDRDKRLPILRSRK